MVKKCLYILLITAPAALSMPCSAHPFKGAKDSVYTLLQHYEDTLNILQYKKIKPRSSDKYKQQANVKFLALIKKALALPGSFDYPFDSLKTITHLTSPDKKFRIYNWDVPQYNGTITYYGFIQTYNPQKKSYSLFLLHDKAAEISRPEYYTGTPAKWLGMLYYKIVPEMKAPNTYILLAWQGYSNLVSHKIIDVLSFTPQGTPVFGKSIFRRPPPGCRSSFKRIIFQYSAKVFMSLDYNSSQKMILFDHHGPPDPSLTGEYQYYGPSLQVDALAYKNNRWIYEANVDARNPRSSMDKYYHNEKDNFKQRKKPIYTPLR